jgi:ferrous iron transport protein B
LGIDATGCDYLIALAGNPNTGKSTLFNTLTGLKQHVGNWPGKTVACASGAFESGGKRYKVVDLPGTYSVLWGAQAEEEIARSFLLKARPDCTVIVVDATLLERNLSLVFQVLELTDRAVVCLNLVDEARRKGVVVDHRRLAEELGVPVVPTVARTGEGVRELLEAAAAVAAGTLETRPRRLGLLLEVSEDRRQEAVQQLYREAEAVAARATRVAPPAGRDWGSRLDRIVTSKIWGFPIMLAGLAAIFWLTIVGANYPSQLLAAFLFGVERLGSSLFEALGAPGWITGFLWHGTYRGVAWVVSVMLPPMAIFFPLFTILENLGFLPRVAFNLDRLFQRVGTQGKQALTMAMGFGCNAAGVVSCRIIDSPRDKLIAILTNTFVPCNGRYPTLIMLGTIFVAASFPPAYASLAAAASVVAAVLVGVAATLLVSWGLSRTALRGEPSSFVLELPPYRRPNVRQVLYTSLVDRTLLVLERAVLMAAPAGALIWLLSNLSWAGQSLAFWASGLLDPLGRAVGLDGAILLAYVIAIPANEIVVPTMLMIYTGAGMLAGVGSLPELRAILIEQQGWTLLTAICLMLFSVLHNPCSTTIWTIYKETGSKRWAAVGALLPLALAFSVTFAVAQAARLFA